MCGIYGMVSLSGHPLRKSAYSDTMRRSLAHRGPDGHGSVSRPHAVIGVNRLRIIDRRSEADQPFTDPSGQVWLAVNGEIYNAHDLRRRFPDFPYRSRSDVEPIIPLYLSRGAAGLAELDGMFAVAIWDERTRTLVLARDRAGEKPLFVNQREPEIWFGSEIQALLTGDKPPVDPHAMNEIVRLGYPLEPRTPWTGISRVGAGTIVSFGSGGRRINSYWEPRAETPIPEGADSVAELGQRLETAVRKQIVADVPVGVFTSGGLDSGLITAMAARHCGADPLQTFTVRFPDQAFDEGRYAGGLAAHVGAVHVEAIATETALTGALDVITRSIAEPITDPAVLPTLILARAAREQVGAVLSGEGADELFGGYPTYLGHQLAPWYNRLPGPARWFARLAVQALPPSYGNVTLPFLLKRFVTGAELPWFERHVRWFGTGLPTDVFEGGWADKRISGPDIKASSYPLIRSKADDLNAVMQWDYKSYLRCLLLPKIDRATSLVALESRAPYLDTEVTRYAQRLRARDKIRGLTTKWLLRRVAQRWLPRWVLRRRKRGLSVPVAAWLNGGLARTVDRVLDPRRLARQGLLNPRAVSQLVAEHRRGRVTAARGLWALVVLQLWMDHWMPEETG